MASSSFKMMMLMLLALLNPSSGFAFVVSKPFHPISVRSHTSTSQLLSGPDLNDLDSLEVVDANDLEDCKKVEDSVWRRGDLDGMDAPIDEGWRQTCESMIQTAATGESVRVIVRAVICCRPHYTLYSNSSYQAAASKSTA